MMILNTKRFEIKRKESMSSSIISGSIIQIIGFDKIVCVGHLLLNDITIIGHLHRNRSCLFHKWWNAFLFVCFSAFLIIAGISIASYLFLQDFLYLYPNIPCWEQTNYFNWRLYYLIMTGLLFLILFTSFQGGHKEIMYIEGWAQD